MDTLLLRTFITVANTSSFSVAAVRLNMTQSTVSSQIARLEDQLGKQLLERTTRSCRLTAEGSELIVHATRIIKQIDEMEQCFRPSLLRGTVTVGIPDDLHLFIPLTRAITSFIEDMPAVAVEIRAGLTTDLSRLLKERQIDVALLREVPARDLADALRIEELVWISSEAWVPGNDGVTPLALVSGACAYRKAATTSLDERGLPWRCLVSCTSLEGVLEVVKAGLAVSVITEGDLRPGVRVVSPGGTLPRLPGSALKIRFAKGSPSHLTKALARTLSNALATS